MRCCVKSSDAPDFVSQQWSGKTSCCDGDSDTSSLDVFLQQTVENTTGQLDLRSGVPPGAYPGKAKRVFYTEQDTEHTVGFFAAGIGEMLSPGEKCLITFPFSGPFGLGDLIAKTDNANSL